MSAIDLFRATVVVSEHNDTLVTLTTERAREILGEIEALQNINKLRKLINTIPLQAGDVVHEIGDPDEIGDVIEVREGPLEVIYRVQLRESLRVLSYYREEVEFMERPGL